MKTLLKNNINFRKFWLSSSISLIGDYIDDIAFTQLVYLVTKSTLLSSYVFAIKLIFTFLSVFTATIADKFNKKNIIVICSYGQGVLLSLVAMLFYFEKLNTFLLLLIVTIQTIFSTLNRPAKNALLPKLLDDKDIVKARAFFNVSTQFIQVFAYLMSGVLISLVGILGAIIIDIITFLISGVIIMSMNKIDDEHIGFESINDYFYNVRLGFKFVLSDKIFIGILIITFWGNILTSPIDSLMPVYFVQASSSSASYSWFMLFIAIGGILSGLVLPRMEKKLSIRILFSIGFLFGGFGMCLLFFNKSIFPYLSGFSIGISYTLVSVLNATIIQMRTPKEMMARTFSIFKCISYTAGPLGIIIAGFIGEYIEMRFIFSLLGIGLSMVSLYSLRVLKEREDSINVLG